MESQTPTLTVEQKQAIKILGLGIENAQLRAQAAQRDFDQSRTELTALLQSLDREGYLIDLGTMAYVKRSETKTE